MGYMIAHAAAEDLAIQFVQKLESVILFPFITLLLVVALIIFLWGAFQFVVKAGDSSARAEGSKHMLWGVIGLLIMLSAYAILSIFVNTFGIDPPAANSPFAPVNSPQPATRGVQGALRADGSAPAATPTPAPRPVNSLPTNLDSALRAELQTAGYSPADVDTNVNFFADPSRSDEEKYTISRNMFSGGLISETTYTQIRAYINSERGDSE